MARIGVRQVISQAKLYNYHDRSMTEKYPFFILLTKGHSNKQETSYIGVFTYMPKSPWSMRNISHKPENRWCVMMWWIYGCSLFNRCLMCFYINWYISVRWNEIQTSILLSVSLAVFPGRSLPWTNRPFAVIKRAITNEFDDSIVHRCLGRWR